MVQRLRCLHLVDGHFSRRMVYSEVIKSNQFHKSVLTKKVYQSIVGKMQEYILGTPMEISLCNWLFGLSQIKSTVI